MTQVGIPKGTERMSINASLQLPSNSTSPNLGPNPKIQEIKEKENSLKEGEESPKNDTHDKGKGPNLP